MLMPIFLIDQYKQRSFNKFQAEEKEDEEEEKKVFHVTAISHPKLIMFHNNR